MQRMLSFPHAVCARRIALPIVVALIHALVGASVARAQDEVAVRNIKVDTIPLSVALKSFERPRIAYGKGIKVPLVQIAFREDVSGGGDYVLTFSYRFRPGPDPGPDPTNRAYCVIVDDGPTPTPPNEVPDSNKRKIVLDTVGQRELVYTGECVVISVAPSVSGTSSVQWESDERGLGYYVILEPRFEKKSLEFRHMCKAYIVDDPSVVDVTVDTVLRYEQIIWTPRADGKWEVRIGTTARRCQSAPLVKLQELRRTTPGYEEGVEARRIMIQPPLSNRPVE